MPFDTFISIGKRIISPRHRRKLVQLRDKLNGYCLETYSQQGEDIILRNLFVGHHQGFYVDIGAYHPFRYSNTYFFYKRGWKGLAVDATPGTAVLFKKYRPRDISIDAAVGREDKEAQLYMFEEGGLNTLSEEVALQQSKIPDRPIIATRQVRIRPLRGIFEDHLAGTQPIDILSIDVEGYDLDVLQSNNWAKYIPKIVVCEDLLLRDLEETGSSPVCEFLKSKGFVLYAKCVHSLIFVHSSFQAGNDYNQRQYRPLGIAADETPVARK